MPRVLSEMGERWRAMLPVRLRDSPEHLAVINAQAREFEMIEAAAAVVRAQFFPQTADVLLSAWEHELRITIEPEGTTVEERRELVLATLQRMRSTPEGRDWAGNVTALIGPGWTYSEHIPGDVSTPPEGTIRIDLPFPPTSASYARVEALIRVITPAHLDIELASPPGSGFTLDVSQLDQEGLQ